MNDAKEGLLIDDPPYRAQQEPPMNLHQLLDAMRVGRSPGIFFASDVKLGMGGGVLGYPAKSSQ
jgi:hypothetical protein